MLDRALRSIPLLKIFLMLAVSVNAHASIAEKPITGGLGITFGQTVPLPSLGSEIPAPYPLPGNKKIQVPELIPGSVLPWRHYLTVNLPRPFRKRKATSHVMVDGANEPIRVTTAIDYSGCEGDFIWLKETLLKKYSVTGETNVEPLEGFAEA